MAPGQDDRCHQPKRDQRQRQWDDSPERECPGAPDSVVLGVVPWEVVDEPVELAVGFRREAAADPILELAGVKASFEVMLTQDLSDRFAFAVADPERAITWTATTVVAVTFFS